MTKKAKTAAKASEDPFSVGHHMGQFYGYDVLPSGEIRIAASLSASMEAVMERECGLREMQEGIARFVAAELAATAKARKEWWSRVLDDLGIQNDPANPWSFHYQTQTVRKIAGDEAGQ